MYRRIFTTDNGRSNGTGELNGKKVIHYNAELKGGKGRPNEGGTRSPSFWFWKGTLGEGVDIAALTAHIDLFKTFADLAGYTGYETYQKLDGLSFLPLLENPNADWPERTLFIHGGRWAKFSLTLDEAKYFNCAVRNDRW
ncbi:sulfatase-like hydrolase/transferase [Bacteroidota bacterium]